MEVNGFSIVRFGIFFNFGENFSLARIQNLSTLRQVTLYCLIFFLILLWIVFIILEKNLRKAS